MNQPTQTQKRRRTRTRLLLGAVSIAGVIAVTVLHVPAAIVTAVQQVITSTITDDGEPTSSTDEPQAPPKAE